MEEARQNVYLSGRSAQVWRNLKPEIKKEYSNISKFFQSIVLAFDGKGSLEARIKMKDIEIQRYEQKIKDLRAEKKALESRLENGEFTSDNGLQLEQSISEHPQFDKAVRIVSRGIRKGDIKSPGSKKQSLVYWSNQLGVSKERMFELAVKHGDVSDNVLEKVNA